MKIYGITSALIFLILPVMVNAGGTHDEDHHDAKKVEDHHKAKQGDEHHASDVGSGGDKTMVDKEVAVQLHDSMKIDFDELHHVNHGDTVNFKVVNTGAIRHEFSIGSEAEQEKHRAMMRQMPNMVHEDENSVTLEAGETKSLVWKFNGDENIVFACNIPGHTEAGMIERKSLN